MKIRKLFFESSLETRQNTESDSTSLGVSGYAAKYNTRSQKIYDFYEEIKPGAFSSALEPSADVRMFWNHNSSEVLGRTVADTLSLRSDSCGLGFDAVFPSWAERHYESIKRGDVTGVSFAFRTIKDIWERLNDDTWLRSLVELELYEISPVTFPAYIDTSVSARNYEKIVQSRQASDLHNNSLNQNQWTDFDLKKRYLEIEELGL